MPGEHTDEIHKMEVTIGKMGQRLDAIELDLRELRAAWRSLENDRVSRAAEMGRVKAIVEGNAKTLESIEETIRSGQRRGKRDAGMWAGGGILGGGAILELLRQLALALSNSGNG